MSTLASAAVFLLCAGVTFAGATPGSGRPRTPLQPLAAMRAASTVLPFVAWPGLLAASMGSAYLLHTRGHGVYVSFLVVYLALVGAIFALERVIPRTEAWLADDHQLGNDLLFTGLTEVFTNHGLATLVDIAATLAMIWLAGLSEPGLWPRHWPVLGQVVLALLLVDFVRYWGHRWSHTVSWFWRFHTVHHSVKKLWVLNTGRVHPGDALPLIFAAGLIAVLRIPQDVVLWQAAFTAYIGIMAHSNIELRLGPLNYVFNTPVLHRWHHSDKELESQHNYQHTLCIYDIAFGSYYNPRNQIPEELGIGEEFPSDFVSQFTYPFVGPRRANGVESPEARDG
jgi:sterol desaturase/sphingolipid hydroxylase (fatty acid hydroxylase superfamily)